jgi:tRNA threonylcarbamoyladenosine biosynthesis protein TsaE
MMERAESSDHHCTWCVDHLSETQLLANALADSLRERTPVVVALVGTLGAGKTQWVKFLANRLGANVDDVSSPTFVLMQRYETTPPIVHLDAYRIGDADEFLELGVEEIFDEPVITLIEWADRFRECMPNNTLWIEIQPTGESSEQRRITLSNLQHHPHLRHALLNMLPHAN